MTAQYNVFVNGQFYGRGPIEYVHELTSDRQSFGADDVIEIKKLCGGDTMKAKFDKSGVLGGNYDSAAMDFEAAHQALLAEARKLGYAEGFEAGRKVEREDAEGESYEKELSKLAKYASVMGETTSNITRDSEASEALNEAYRSGPIESAIKETRAYNQQALRDGIVEQAKADVVYLRERMISNEVNSEGNPTFQGLRTISEFHVNRKKRTVVVLVKGASTSTLLEKGIAKCAPGDCFNVHIGKAIALRRALGLPVPDEYLNAPQPTEVRVGDVVGFPTRKFDGRRLVVVEVNETCCLYRHEKFQDDSNSAFKLTGRNLKDARIVDDSRDGEQAV